jgi:hypothetical protein
MGATARQKAHVLEALDGGAAMLEALQYLDGYDIEVWDLFPPGGQAV